MSEAEARLSMELTIIAAALEERGHEVLLVERSDEVPLDLLLVGIDPDDQGRQRTVSLAFLPFELDDLEATKFLQLHHVLPFPVHGEHRDETARLLLRMNQGVALGHYGLKDDTELHLRWVSALPVFDQVQVDWLGEVLQVFAISADIFSPHVEAVASGGTSAAEALAELGI